MPPLASGKNKASCTRASEITVVLHDSNFLYIILILLTSLTHCLYTDCSVNSTRKANHCCPQLELVADYHLVLKFVVNSHYIALQQQVDTQLMTGCLGWLSAQYILGSDFLHSWSVVYIYKAQ